MSDLRSPRLVGRGRELAQLEAGLANAFAGRGSLILLTGEPGIGKTALAREFVEQAGAAGATWAWGSCWDGGGAPAYWPWVQVGRVLGRRADPPALRDALGEGAPWIAGLLPELAGALGPAAEPSELDSDQARFRLFDALASLLAAAAAPRPLVVVLDDLHWADASSLLALEFVARALPDIPLLAIAAYRHAEAHARPDLAGPLGGLARAATRLPLEGLGRDEVAELAQARARGLNAAARAPIPPQLITAVHRASAGNPFFADELVQLLVAQGRLHDDSAASRPLPLPDGVRDAIRRRLDPLEPPVLEALGAAAVIGGEFGLHTLAGVLGEPPSVVLERLDVPVRSGIVETGRDAGRYGLHALVRDTLLEGLGARRRAQLHHATAKVLEDIYGDDLEQHLAEIAHHYLQAASEGGAERAVEFAARAAQRAVTQFAYEEAARLYERALDVAASLPADDARAWRLMQGLGEARMRAGDVEGARDALRSAGECARRSADPERLAQTALAGRSAPSPPGSWSPSSSRRSRRRSPPWTPPGRTTTRCGARRSPRCAAACACSWRSPCTGRRRACAASSSSTRRWRSRATCTPASPGKGRGRTGCSATARSRSRSPRASSRSGDPRRSPAGCRSRSRHSSCASARRTPSWRCRCACGGSACCSSSTTASARRRRSRPSARPRGGSASRGCSSTTRCTARWPRTCAASSRHPSGFTAEAAAQSRDVPGSIAPIIADAQTFLVRRTQGRHLDLEPLVRKNADRLPAMRRWRCGLALVLAELGREDEARRELEQLAAADFEDIPRDALWLVSMSLLAELCALLDDRPRARRLYDLLVPYEGRNVVSMGAAYLGPVARYLGMLAMTMREDERALGHLETARSAAERMGARPTVVLTALDAAEVLARRDAPGRRAPRPRAGPAVAQDAAQMQMDGAIARADDLLARLEEAAHPARPAVAGRPLQAALRREQDVWLLEYDGRSVCLQDAKGLHHLAALLAEPGTPIPALDLAGGEAGG